MQLFLDTANISHIERAASWGVINGVTTNPTLLAKEGFSSYKEAVLKICELVDGPVSVEVTKTDADGMIEQAKKLAGWHKNIVVKIPVGEEGLKAIKKLGELGIKTNCTLVFSANQALLAALAGATFVSPFLGRIDDMGNDGMRALAEIVGIYDVYGFETKIIAASIRHPMHVVEAALLGTDIATVPFEVLERMIKHPLTDIGLKKFLEDAEKAKIEL